MAKKITINKIRGVMYRGAKYMGDLQAFLKAINALEKGEGNKALNIVKKRTVTRVAGKFTGRGLGYVRKKTSECFIATTVYGDKEAYQVQMLRRYRDEVMMQSFFGRRLVDLYYSGFGEKLAYFIENKIPRTIPLVRGGLDLMVENMKL